MGKQARTAIVTLLMFSGLFAAASLYFQAPWYLGLTIVCALIAVAAIYFQRRG